MTPIIERDPQNKRTVAMWDECGMRFRSNLVEPGGRIELHAHSYDHVAAVWGPFRVTLRDPQGNSEVREQERGKFTVLAGWTHGFEYLGHTIGEVLCFWPIGADGVT